MSLFSDLFGTLNSYFKIGLAGVRLKNSSGNLLVRNNGDSADAEITASKANISGDSIVVNSDAAGSGNDWLLTLQRNAAQTAALTVVTPPAKGTDGHVLRQKSGTAGGVLELELVAAGSTTQCDTVDTTSLAFGDSSPVAMFSMPADAVVDFVDLIVDTAFNGTAPTASIGVSGTTSKYMASTQNDLKTAGVYRVHPGLPANGSSESLIVTYAADSSSAGAARVLVHYSVPQ
jgi:hypothetical protein